MYLIVQFQCTRIAVLLTNTLLQKRLYELDRVQCPDIGPFVLSYKLHLVPKLLSSAPFRPLPL